VRQRAVLDAIQAWIREHGYPPTIRELGARLGIKSLRGVTAHLDALAKKGWLQREARARSIRLAEELRAPVERLLRIPVLGQIRAGAPVLAEEHVDGHLLVDPSWISGAGQAAGTHFALRVRGDSMIGAGILDGDVVIVRQQPTAEPNDIVVALVGGEATVKRFVKRGEQIRLQPEHPTMPPIVPTPAEGLALLGKVVAVFRHLT
jgi:repressor LexA